jgi:hypothetical protein
MLSGLASQPTVHEYGVPSILSDPADDQRLWEGIAMVAPCDLPALDEPR